MANAKQGLTIEFKKEKDTKNTTRYKEQVEGDDPPVIGTLYLTKEVAAEVGEDLTVTVAPS
jgi:hypothetical protein